MAHHHLVPHCLAWEGAGEQEGEGEGWGVTCRQVEGWAEASVHLLLVVLGLEGGRGGLWEGG